MQQIWVKYNLIIRMSQKSDNWVGEYPVGPLVHQHKAKQAVHFFGWSLLSLGHYPEMNNTELEIEQCDP